MLLAFVRKNWRSLFIALSLLTDMTAMAISAVCAFHIGLRLPEVPEWYMRFVIIRMVQFSAILIFFGLVFGLYRAAYHIHVRQQYALAFRSYVYSIIVTFASFYAFHFVHFPRRFSFLYFLLLPFFFLIGRTWLNHFNLKMQQKGFGIHNALIYGFEEENTAVLDRFASIPELGYRIKGIVSRNHHSAGIPRYSYSQLREVLAKEGIDRIFLPSAKLFTAAVPELAKICREWKIKLKVLSPEAEDLLRTAKVYDIVGITLYSPPSKKSDYLRRVVKRTFDIVGSTVLILILSPLLLITALAILLETGLPIIFKQSRSRTKKGKAFDLYKFRSMVQNADQLKEDLFEFNEADGALFKLKSDPRVTKVGKILRKLSIDELPQLFNVLKGDMSLVGPRPLPIPDFEKVLEGPEFWEAIKDRETMKPGITGLWQVSGRSDLGFREMVLLDLYYIENQSFLFDLEILVETIPVMLFGRGAY